MSRYFVVKTGFEMFDLSRAYGLGVLLRGPSEAETYMHDRTYYYEISVSEVFNINTKKLRPFLRGDLNWRECLLTAPGKGRIDSAKVEEVKNFFMDKNSSKRISDLLNRYSFFKPVEIPSVEGETLYEPMELRATKGLRDTIRLRKKYSEGSSIKVKEEDWMLSLLGHLNITSWKYDVLPRGVAGELLVAMPIPSLEGTEVMELLREIKGERIDKAIRRMHQAGKMSTLAWMGVKIVEATLELTERVFVPEYTPRFSSILYGSMKATGKGGVKRWKPATAGMFPLEYLNKIAEDKEESKNLLSSFDEFFRKTNKAGYEDLAASLSTYLADPSFINFENYLRHHLRYSLTKEAKLPLYTRKTMGGMMKHVRS